MSPTVIEQLASIVARIEALEERATIETNGLATADSVTAVSNRLQVIEQTVGTAVPAQ